MTANKNAPLSYEIKDDKLVISIGISTLAFAALEENGGPVDDLVIEDENQWAKDVLNELESGDYAQHFLDKAMVSVAEGGSEAFLE